MIVFSAHFFFSLTVSRRLFYTWQWHWRKGELPLDTAREQNHSRVCIEHAPSRETQVKGTLNSPASDASVRAHIRVAQLEFFSAIQGAWGNANSPAGALWSRCGGTEVDIRIIKYGFRHIMFGIKDSQFLCGLLRMQIN